MIVNEDLRMELADCGSPERILAAILAHHSEWTPPIPLEAFCISMGITKIEPLESEGFEGALVTDENKALGAILFNGRSALPRRRFTIGHELGHFLIPSHVGSQKCSSSDMTERGQGTQRAKQEAEANRFAAGLLMPPNMFRRAMAQIGDFGLATVRQLATTFETSFEATANRSIELSDERCAFVYVKDGVLRYTKRSKDFPVIAFRSGDKIPTRFIPAMARELDGTWAECDGSEWLIEGGKRSPVITWQAASFSNGKSVILLTLEPEDEGGEDDEEYDTGWSPRFRR